MKKLTLAALLLALAANPNNSSAQVIPASEAGRVTEGFRQEKRPTIFKTPLIEIDDSTESVNKGDDSVKFYLEDVVFAGNNVLSDADFQAVKAKYAERKVSLAEVNQLANDITVKYRNEGYISSKAIIPPQKIKNGVLKVEVIEGGVDKVIVEGADIDDSALINKFADKIRKAGPMSAKKLERYLLLIDDLPGITARAVLRSSPNKVGYSNVHILLEEKKFDAAIGVDNFSSRFLGEHKFDAQGSINSPFGKHGRTTVRGIITPEIEELRYISLQHEAQMGDEGLKMILGTSYTDTEPGQKLEALNIEGQSFNASINFQNPLIRSRQENLYSRWGFNYKTAKSDTFDVAQFKDEVRTIDLGVTYDVFDMLNGTNQAELLFTKGLSILDATEDTDLRSRANADGSFERINFTYTRIQAIADLPFSIFVSSAGQYSWSPLLSSEEFGIGGRFYGRGYDPSEISGDMGLAGTAEARYSTQEGYGFIDSYQPFAFYDVGKVWNRDTFVGEAQNATLASAGIGARMNFDYDVSGEALVAVPLNREINTYGTNGHRPRFHFALTKRF